MHYLLITPISVLGGTVERVLAAALTGVLSALLPSSNVVWDGDTDRCLSLGKPPIKHVKLYFH